MRPDDINPRTGLVVAVVSVFLVFGFMFTVSGIKGEFLGDIPLLAIGPAIFFPGVAAIVLAKRTDGCTRWPDNMPACAKKAKKDKEDIELLKTPSDLESGKGSSDELDTKSGPKDPFMQNRRDTVSSLRTAEECKALVGGVDQDEVLQYLEECYCTGPLTGGSDAATYCVFQKINSATNRILYTAAEDRIVFASRDDSAAGSQGENSPSPDDRYCCYINPQEVSWDRETIV